MRDAVVDAGTVGTGLWISYLFALFYFAIAAGAVTHRDLLVENPVKLPFLNVELPLKSFFILGPLVFLIVHAYVLLHFVLLAGKIGAFHTELQAQISDDDARARLRRQLPSNIFVQFLSGPPEVRHGIVGFLLKLVAWLSLVAGPIALLILFQLQFLPYHSGWITMWQRIAVVIDIALLWILWPSIARGETAWLGWSDFRRAKVGALVLASFLPILLVVTIATFPGEWLEEKMPPVRFIPTTWKAWTLPSVQAIQAPGSGWISLHELLVAGKVSLVTGPQSLWSNVLVVPRFVARDTVKFDEAEGKVAVSSNPLSLRGRSLEGAVLVLANLRGADFTGARLTGAYFVGADLRNAKFRCDEIGDINQLSGVESDEPAICTQLQRANLDLADLQDANLKNAALHHARLVGAKLQGADLTGARLEGADLTAANLEGANLTAVELRAADLNDTQLQGASLDHAQLQAAFLSDTQLQGASLDHAQLQGASVVGAQMQGASLVGAQMDGALLRNVFVWRTTAPSNATQVVVIAPEPGPKYSGLGCVRVSCEWSETSYLSLKSLIENSVPAGQRRDQTLQRIKALAKPPYVADASSAKAWTDLTGYAAWAGSYVNTRAKVFKEIGCSAEGAPYVIGALIKYLGELSDYNLLQKLAAAFLDEVRCPGARGLGKEYKEALQEIRDRDLPASPGPSISAQ